MKKFISATLITLLAISYTAGCDSESNVVPERSTGSAANSSVQTDSSTDTGLMPDKELTIDVDIAGLRLLVVHGEVNKILTNPENYIGKRVRMSGNYYYMTSQDRSMRYHYIAVEPGDSCCVRGLEFAWDADGAFPDGFPNEWADIEITGVYASYTESGETYYYIAVEEFEAL